MVNLAAYTLWAEMMMEEKSAACHTNDCLVSCFTIVTQIISVTERPKETMPLLTKFIAVNSVSKSPFKKKSSNKMLYTFQEARTRGPVPPSEKVQQNR